ncbi:MAG: hypothetical protein ACYC77_10720 [Coriobacteriia bacterium]
MSLGEDTKKISRTAWLRIVVAAAVVIVFANVAAIGVSALGPERCLSCHGPSGKALEIREAHAKAACLDCHGGTTALDTLDFAGRQVYGMYLRLPVLPGRDTAAVSDAICSGCHEVTKAPSDKGGIRVNHATCAVGRSCTDCHSRVAHGDSVTWPREYDMFECVPCHMTAAKSVECDLCHTERTQEERIRTGSFALTHAANWQQTHGMGDSLACAACHAAEKCVKCHGAGVPHTPAFATSHSELSQRADAQCESCHARKFCDDCHGIEMPHPESFTPKHSAIVETQGRAVCDDCHAPSDCVTCHVKHVHPGNAKLSGGE